MISIIVVCFNSAKTIKRSIESIIGQDNQDYEIIFIDGGSTDGTLDIIASYEVPKSVYSEKDEGIYDAMNKGLSVANGEYLLYLNSDDYFTDSSALGYIQKACVKGPDFIFGDIRYALGEKILRRWCSDISRVSILNAASHIPHASLTVKKSIMQKLNGFDTKFDFAADFDLIFRLLNITANYVYIPQELVEMAHGGKTSSGVSSWYRQQLEIYQILTRKHSIRHYEFLFFILERFQFKIKQHFYK